MNLIISLWFCCASLYAATYYVSPSGNDVTGKGSIELPWKTMRHGMDQMSGGDTLYLRGGEYHEKRIYGADLLKSGLSFEQPTTIASYPGERAVLVGTEIDTSVMGAQFQFDSKRYEYIVLDGWTIDLRLETDFNASKRVGMKVNLKNSTITRMHFVNIINQSALQIAGNPDSWSENVTISSCVFRNIATPRGYGPGIYAWRIQDSVIENSLWINNSGSAIQLASDVAGFGAHRIKVRNNVIKPGASYRQWHGFFMNGFHNEISEIEIYNNLFINLGWNHPKGVDSFNVFINGNNCQIHNNTMFRDVTGGGVIAIYKKRGTNNHIANNIIWGTWTQTLVIGDYPGTTYVTNNIMDKLPKYHGGTVIEAPYKPYGLNYNPQFVDAPKDLRFLPGSPAQSNGYDLSNFFTVDHYGNERVTPWDIGAFIYASKFSDEPSVIPSAPGNLTAAAASSSQINLSWDDRSHNEMGFRIERKTGSGGTYSQIATVGPNVKTYQNTGLSADTTYVYRVRATNGAGNSAFTNEAIATTMESTSSGSDVAGGFTQFKTVFVPQEEKELVISYSPSSGGGCEGQIAIYNQHGQIVRSLMRGVGSSECEVRWPGTNDGGQPVASGVYTVILRQDGQTFTKKVAVVR